MIDTTLRRLTWSLFALFALVAASCGSDSEASADGDGDGEITITDAWTRVPADGQTVSAAYGVVTNGTDADVTIVAASSPVSDTVELHETTMDDDGVMQMNEREEGFVVPAGGDFVFEPGGPHVMVMDIDPATYPDTLEVTFEFDTGEELTFSAEARAVEGTDEMDHDDMDDMDEMESDDMADMDEG